MTKTLKQQLALLALAGIAAFGARHIAAQNAAPQSAAEAAQLFGRLLAAHDPKVKDEDNNPDKYLRFRLISRANDDKLLAGSFEGLLQELQIAATRPQFDIASQKSEGAATVVEIAPAAKSRALPVVVVRENGGFRIDLLATYAKRFDIAPENLAEEIYQRSYSHVVLAGLPFVKSPQVQNQICQSRLKQIGLGIRQYISDYDEKYPRAANWQENVQPYLRDSKMFHCPAAAQNGYAYNANLAQQTEMEIENSTLSIAVYETSDLRPDAVGIGRDLAFRHQGYSSEPPDVNQTQAAGSGPGANFLFTDGHIAFRSQQRRSDFSLNPTSPKPAK